MFGALACSQGALGTRVQVHGACLGGRLDRQEFDRAQLLMEIPSVFLTILFFALNDFGRSRGGPGSMFGGQGGVQGVPKMIDRFFWGPQGVPNRNKH